MRSCWCWWLGGVTGGDTWVVALPAGQKVCLRSRSRCIYIFCLHSVGQHDEECAAQMGLHRFVILEALMYGRAR
jgi:hypothetical protein